MSLTSTVPAGVPSVFHSSFPVAGVLPVKSSVPLTFVRFPIGSPLVSAALTGIITSRQARRAVL
jgi:hypothetical protein